MLERCTGGSAAALIVAVCLPALVSASPGASPVADAAMQGDLDVARSLLREGADVNAADASGRTAVDAARYESVVAFLVGSGASVPNR